MNQALKEKIIAESKKIGIDKIGFTDGAPFSHLEESLREQKDAGHTTGFEHPDFEERIYPQKIFEDPRSIIAIALAYPTKMTQKAEMIRGERRGSFARASWGTDYHIILRERMNRLISFIEKEVPHELGPKFKPIVDTGELIDVAVAQRAGLGFIGKNGLLITEEFGSYVYLGEIITNIPFEKDVPMESQCGECTKCIDLCPTSALLGDGRMNGQRCLSYQTQTRGMMPEEYREKIRTVIYGCDICQQVCPFNQGKDTHYHKEMEPEPEIVTPLLRPLLTISNKEFKDKFGHLAGSWRGKKPIQRNAIIALGNARQKNALPDLLMVAEKDPRADIRATAFWSIGKIMGSRLDESMKASLVRLSAHEKDEVVRSEIKKILASFSEQEENN
ncbi:tRNA epoxyqueuosine(34) reductase QueG [Vagococcus elongatus]|uniref:tRNA epoxyqueuosine(34) reductase QueG n=1 Tax=Vagococcus elongatus TaxID=180344 RepID=A0A430B4J1_9ENTE|nr:tRNA epoxyqueuosine(34) reductase QueG [Vagococcus elongatus]RSU15219.1 tRNA epoxyqueuosine(34) reductase QueG [Vagococcus elongatus]